MKENNSKDTSSKKRKEVKIKGNLPTVLSAIPELDLLRLNLADIMPFVKIAIGILRIKNVLCARLKLMEYSKLSKEKSDQFNFFRCRKMKSFKKKMFQAIKDQFEKKNQIFYVVFSNHQSSVYFALSRIKKMEKYHFYNY